MEPHPFELALAADWPLNLWQNASVLVAVSGGADSVALVRALAALRTAGQKRLAIAHFNHRLRTDAVQDADFVTELASQLNLPIELGQADTAATARADGDGLEAAARDERYRFLQATAERIDTYFVVAAHTADDQAETILHHILRGTGVAGLVGMRRTRPLGKRVTLIRPLLGMTRADVLAYLAHLGQPYREDASNASLAHTRNRIRHSLLPLLRADYNPEVTSALLRLSTTAADAQRVIHQLVSLWIEFVVRFDSPSRATIECRHLVGEDRHLIRELFVAIWRHQSWPQQSMGFTQWNRLAEMVLASAPQKQTFPGPIMAERTAATLSLQRIE